MPISFQLYMLVNTDLPHNYPYAAVSPATHKIMIICDEHIAILDPVDTYFVESDYMPTSRSISFDLEMLDNIVANYIGPHEYNIITRFTPEKHITLRYHSPTNEGPKDYDIYLGYPDKRAVKAVEEIYAIMEATKQLALAVD
jgi:hypothetical protein